MRPRIFDEEEVLDKALTAFWGRGLTATSAEDLLKAMGIGQGSLYHSYKQGKKEVFEKAVKQFHRKTFTVFKNKVNGSDQPLNVIRQFFMNMALASHEEHLKGCLMGNTIVEMSLLDQHLEKEAVMILKEVEQLFSETIERARSNGQLKSKTPSMVLARQLITLWNGLNITRRMYPDNDVMKELITADLEILN
ncbi:TetR/AcrR family transcriptional regulator [Mucilaginibacter jinjuensis]|uniref:TetR family transcriptional regulator C-terminal domain-containing protein n=1 Tax=Mucilaginibacter jinjuensis TaxID=1176721 RepID=A0ABY7TCQ0_9SPHI|nr:TetR family transcriptional regulator C-terminal domain-containing protein [Mucilaginibacter jinjuensis]WCT14285.1 TetR family transcriptional regulator C-terminal domain-containing protein [Mucilaginibacter jinjuensis]